MKLSIAACVFSCGLVAQTTWVVHSGGGPGVKAVVVWSPARQAYAAIALTGEGSAEATANRLFAALAAAP